MTYLRGWRDCLALLGDGARELWRAIRHLPPTPFP